MIIPKTKLIGVKCSEAIFDRVVLLADKLEVSNGEILRRALDAYLELIKVAEKRAKAKEGKK